MNTYTLQKTSSKTAPAAVASSYISSILLALIITRVLPVFASH